MLNEIEAELYTDRPMISLRKYIGKQLVSFLRKGDFAHAGEDEAIELVMSYFKKDTKQTILDVGCGLGGTAEYIQNHSWGNISGFDIEPEAIKYAQQKYPGITFYTCDVIEADKFIHEQFDILTLFNVFYAFSNQSLALKVLNKLTNINGEIAIFDYSDPCKNQTTPLFRAGSETITPFIPIKLNQIDELLDNTGWQISKVIDISEQYLAWYNHLIQRLLDSKADVLDKFNSQAFENALSTYTKIRDGILEGLLGGVIIYAKKLAHYR